MSRLEVVGVAGEERKLGGNGGGSDEEVDGSGSSGFATSGLNGGVDQAVGPGGIGVEGERVCLGALALDRGGAVSTGVAAARDSAGDEATVSAMVAASRSWLSSGWLTVDSADSPAERDLPSGGGRRPPQVTGAPWDRRGVGWCRRSGRTG